MEFTTAAADLAVGADVGVDAICPAGKVAIGGGVRGDDTDSEDTTVIASRPLSTAGGGAPADGQSFIGWRGNVKHNTGSAATDVNPQVWAICVSAP